MARSTQSKLMDAWGPLSKTKPKPLSSTAPSSRRRTRQDEEDDDELDLEEEERLVLSDGEEQPRLESGTGEFESVLMLLKGKLSWAWKEE